MRKKFPYYTLLATLYTLPMRVWAGNPFDSEAFKQLRNTAGYADSGENTLEWVLGRVVFSIVTFIGILFILLVFYGGYVWMMARGDEGQVRKAKTIIRDAIIGLIVLAASYSIWILIETLLGL